MRRRKKVMGREKSGEGERRRRSEGEGVGSRPPQRRNDHDPRTPRKGRLRPGKLQLNLRTLTRRR